MFLYHCISEGRLSLKKCSMSFSIHLACYMPDKAAKLRAALLTAVTGETSISPVLKHLLLAKNECAFSIIPLIYAANIFCLLSKNNLL